MLEVLEKRNVRIQDLPVLAAPRYDGCYAPDDGMKKKESGAGQGDIEPQPLVRPVVDKSEGQDGSRDGCDWRSNDRMEHDQQSG